MNAMSRILPILLVLIAFLPLGTCSAQSTANEKYDLELERFIRGTNRDVKNLERDVKYILRKIGDLELPRCVVNRWLKNYESSRSSTIQILRDRLDYQEELVTKVKSRLAELFPEQERISDSVSSLAKKIAANEGGISRVEETIIPEIKKYLEQHRGLISDNLALILVVDAKYDLKFSDICTRMRAKEQRLAQQSQELQAQANQNIQLEFGAT